jgi:chemotaxis protein MotB
MQPRTPSYRANAACYELNQSGLAGHKILRVVGLSSSIPYNPSDLLDTMNIRLSVIVINKIEQQILQEAGKEARLLQNHPRKRRTKH